MTGGMIGRGSCCICGRLFPFDIDLVPSYQGAPICRVCAEQVNEVRRLLGRPVLTIPDGAYPSTVTP